MKQWIWDHIIIPLFPDQLGRFYHQTIAIEQDHLREKEAAQRNRKITVNYPVGTKIILRSNEPDELVIGEVVGYWRNNDQVFLSIKDAEIGVVYNSICTEPPYWSKEREAALRKLNWAEQWNVMSKYYDIDEEHQKNRERAYREEGKL